MSSEDEDAAALLNFVATRLLRLARSPAQEAGLSSAQYSAMSVIFQQPGISLVALAEEEKVRHPTMSRQVRALIAAGLVTRSADDGDKRATRLALSEAGRARYRAATERRVALFEMVLAQLSPAARAEVLALARSLSALTGVESPLPRGNM